MSSKKKIEDERRQFAAMLAMLQELWVESVIGSLSEEEVLTLWRRCQQKKKDDRATTSESSVQLDRDKG